ncbi:hypothetical protein [Phaeodactylibacter xiamenensis]|uniref:hypothetical protein n=1 Tax=Phaeodactylibacter xiamenensis TaxID=1524460 RepID=UPI0024A83B74|nr:hypothetical protein [Phaeodactylibacter xiamenensis]
MNWLNRLFTKYRHPKSATKFNVLAQFIYDLRHSKYPKTQMDIYYDKQLVLQLFNQKDINSWELKIPIIPDKNGGVLIALSFNKEIIDDEQNFDRFFKSPFFKSSVLLSHSGAESYFIAYPSSMSDNAIAEKVKNILNQVYLIDDSAELAVYVRAF